MRCSICGNENPETHRFCGSCGAALVTAPSRAAVPSAVLRNESDKLPQPAARGESPTANSPIISGPSFLGLNQPGPRRSELSSFDYLLEEEEEHKGGKGKYILILMALLIAAGFGYLRWKNQTQGWFSASKPPAAEQTTDDSNGSSTPPPSSPAAPSPEVAKSQSAPTTNNQPSAGSASTPPASGTTGAAPANAAPANPVPDGATKDAPPVGATADNAASSVKKNSSDSDSAADQPDNPPVTEEKKTAPVHTTKPKPSLARPADTSNVVAEATRYIYGKGASQDCDRGLRLLKPAANQSDPRAMIQMGALYSAGLCTPRDLPTAYRWFALALRKEPDNMSVQNDLQKLWGEMTQPERQLAIRLTH